MFLICIKSCRRLIPNVSNKIVYSAGGWGGFRKPISNKLKSDWGEFSLGKSYLEKIFSAAQLAEQKESNPAERFEDGEDDK